MEPSFFLDVAAPDFQEKMTVMYKSLDGQDPLLCALIGAAHIDKCLVALLDAFLIQGKTTKEKHYIDIQRGALTSLYTRAEFVYMLGMITSTTLENIKTICTIRNKFAHGHTPLTFDSEDVAEFCKKLKLQSPVVEITDPTFPKASYDEWLNLNRNRFVKAVSETVLTLAFLPQQMKRPSTPYIDGEPLG